MDIPDVQHAVFVAATSTLAEPHEVFAAAQVTLVSADKVEAHRLRETIRDLALGGPHQWAERRSQYVWGERGEDVQDVFLTVSEEHELTKEQFVAEIGALRAPIGLDEMLGDSPPPTDVDSAWDLLANFLERSCRASRLRLVEAEEVADGWAISARGRTYTYEGHITGDGRVMTAEAGAF